MEGKDKDLERVAFRFTHGGGRQRFFVLYKEGSDLALRAAKSKEAALAMATPDHPANQGACLGWWSSNVSRIQSSGARDAIVKAFNEKHGTSYTRLLVYVI